MNWEYFNVFGYLSVLLWIGVPLLWFVHSRMRPRRWLCHVAVLVGLLALVLAKINSATYVNRIQLDRSEQVVDLVAQQEAKRQAALDSRGEDVAQIRFAEDGSDDFLDRAGMDEADLKYMEKLDEPAVPEWQKEKKTRAGEGAPDEGLEGLIGAGEKSEGVASEALEEAIEEEPILMSAKDLAMANRLDGLNLKAIRFIILLGVLLVVIDYLRRANVYREAYLPLPLPSAWINSLTPPEVVAERPEAARRTVAEELAWLTKRGDSFVYLCDDPSRAKSLPETSPRFAKGRGMVDLLRVNGGGDEIGDEFVFESLWYGRSSFVVDSAVRAERMLEEFTERLEKRKIARARVRQTVHVVWDLKEPLPEETRTAFERLAPATGFSLFVCGGSRSR